VSSACRPTGSPVRATAPGAVLPSRDHRRLAHRQRDACQFSAQDTVVPRAVHTLENAPPSSGHPASRDLPCRSGAQRSDKNPICGRMSWNGRNPPNSHQHQRTARRASRSRVEVPALRTATAHDLCACGKNATGRPVTKTNPSIRQGWAWPNQRRSKDPTNPKPDARSRGAKRSATNDQTKPSDERSAIKRNRATRQTNPRACRRTNPSRAAFLGPG